MKLPEQDAKPQVASIVAAIALPYEGFGTMALALDKPIPSTRWQNANKHEHVLSPTVAGRERFAHVIRSLPFGTGDPDLVPESSTNSGTLL